jgi:hypothetical protein
MVGKRKGLVVLISAGAMALLTLDTKTALTGAAQGVWLCVRTVVPSLFPFFVLSSLLTASLYDVTNPFLKLICRFLGLPQGSGGIFLTGILAGYPVGAQCVYQAWHEQRLSKRDAGRMLGFCSNAGPSFIFGIAAALFSSPFTGWWLWGIQILSAMGAGILLPGKSEGMVKSCSHPGLTISQALERSVRSLGNVCGWVVLFRVIIAVLEKWILRFLPDSVGVICAGVLELTNGCVSLAAIQDEGMRFVLCGGFLSFGGLCVGMQTVSAVKELGMGQYFPGKLLQTSLSMGLCMMCMPILFPSSPVPSPVCWLIPGCVVILILKFVEITLEIRRHPLYNIQNNCCKGDYHAVSQENRALLQLLRLRHKNRRGNDPLHQKRDCKNRRCLP